MKYVQSLGYPITRKAPQGISVLLRLTSRIYLGMTALFYVLIGLFLSLNLNTYSEIGGQASFWACAFVFTGVLSIMSWLDPRYRLAKPVLMLAAAVAGGFACLFFARVMEQQSEFLIAAAMWGYIACTHIDYAKRPDPYVLSLFEHEVRDLEKQIRNARG